MSLADGQLCFLWLGVTLGRADVSAALRLPLPAAAEEEPAFLQELATFMIANRVPTGARVVLGAPRQDFLLRRFDTPPVKAASLPELVGFEAERHLPGRREDFLSGWKVEGRSAAGGHTLIFGAVRTSALERAIALLKRANLAPASIQPEPFVLAACVRRLAPETRDALVLDVQPGAIGADLLRGGRVEFSRTFPVDDPQWRESFAAAAPPATAAGIAAETRPDVAARLGASLAERLKAPVFLESLPGRKLPPLLLLGPGANRARLVGSLQESLGVPVRTLSPWPLVHWAAPPADLGPFGGALALALLADSETRGLELAAERQEELHRAPSIRLTVALAVLLALVLGTQLVAYGLQKQRRMALVDHEVKTLKTRLNAVEAVNRRVQEQRTRLAFLKTAVNGRGRQAEILRELTGLLPDTAYLNEYTFRDRTVEITGLAPSASQLLPVLEASPLFTGVEFSAPIVAQGAGLERFRIRLRLENAGG